MPCGLCPASAHWIGPEDCDSLEGLRKSERPPAAKRPTVQPPSSPTSSRSVTTPEASNACNMPVIRTNKWKSPNQRRNSPLSTLEEHMSLLSVSFGPYQRPHTSQALRPRTSKLPRTTSRLTGLPTELVGQIASYLTKKDCGNLRLSCWQVYRKAALDYARLFSQVRVEYCEREAAKLCIFTETRDIARSIRLLVLTPLDDAAKYFQDPHPVPHEPVTAERLRINAGLQPNPAPTVESMQHNTVRRLQLATQAAFFEAERQCCMLGAMAVFLTAALRRMVNLEEIRLQARYFDLDSVPCVVSRCRAELPHHVVILAVFAALSVSGIRVRRFAIQESLALDWTPSTACNNRPALFMPVLGSITHLDFTIGPGVAIWPCKCSFPCTLPSSD